MATGPVESSLSVLLLIFLVFGSTGETEIQAEPGQSVTLTCRTNDRKPAVVVEWSRTDVGRKEHVALYQDDQFDPEEQHPSYQNRVDLQDREMKDGDVSLVLKNVTTDDTGTYECRVAQRGNKRRKRSHLKTDPISIIRLDVSPPGKKDEQQDGGKKDEQKDGGKKDRQQDGGGLIVGVLVGVTVSVVLVSLVGGFLVSKHQRRLSHEQNPPPAAERQPMNAENRPQVES
ncbi:hypothetical protein CHARACLAT_030408 [Characodon lateralis]|uniref:Ig-like domain-containing protein n=1 Tax=Characodon lateralis TaxID=208331 RepID=A0ABU7CSK1_9TELE|nr:hypothetical protein [Characodon lateralis]